MYQIHYILSLYLYVRELSNSRAYASTALRIFSKDNSLTIQFDIIPYFLK